MRPGDLTPDHPDVGAADLTLGPVNESDLLAEVEVGGLGVVNTLDLDQAVWDIRLYSSICANGACDYKYLVLGLVLCFERW